MTSDQPISARKLPVKRKSPESPFPPNPNPNPNPNEAGYDVAVDEGEGRSDGIGYGDDYDEEEEEEEDEYFDLEGVLAVPEPAAAALPTTPPPPFKFQRIWSESDEIRFLQGLLACRTQGLTFPRDLNLFFDRFSETMTQPYTRTQLYEKLRRLRKKFRIVSARVSRGLDPSTALTPHDRDLLHVSTQLWHPSCASSSPFSSPGPDNKRRRTGKSARSSSGRPRGRPRKTPNPNPNPDPNLSAQPASPPPPPPAPALQTTTPAAPPPLRPTLPEKVEFLEKKGNFDSGGLGVVTAKAIRDVFDSSLEEVRMELVNHGLLYPDHCHMSGSIGDLTRMCQEQRVGELDAMARRLKLLLEHAIQR